MTITGIDSTSDVSAINDNVNLKVEVANGSSVTLDTAKLGLDNAGNNSDELMINGALSATAAQLKELLDGGVTISGSGSVVIDNYTGQNISALTNAGIKLTLDIDGTDISLTTANLGNLDNITAIQVAEDTSVALTSDLGATLAAKFVSENSTFGELKLSGYSSQDLAPIAHNFVVSDDSMR